MKIHQLPDGARFEYEGKEYVKSGPMFGTGADGQRMIPRYAVLKPLDAVVPTTEKKGVSMLPRADVLRAFEAFYAECYTLVPVSERLALEAAKGRALKLLER